MDRTTQETTQVLVYHLGATQVVRLVGSIEFRSPYAQLFAHIGHYYALNAIKCAVFFKQWI